jgi:hypothetical protein
MKSQKYRVVKLIHEDLLKNFEHSESEWEVIVEHEDQEGAAEQAAEELYEEQTSCGSSNVEDWPITFLVADETGHVARILVNAEFSPTFWAQSSELNVAHLKK